MKQKFYLAQYSVDRYKREQNLPSANLQHLSYHIFQDCSLLKHNTTPIVERRLSVTIEQMNDGFFINNRGPMVLCCSKCFAMKHGNWLREKVAKDYEREMQQRVKKAIKQKVSHWLGK